MRTTSRLLATGLRHRRAGDFKQAESACRQALAQTPNQPEALHLLGLLALDRGNAQAAAALIAKAIHIAGPDARYCLSLGLALRRQGNLAGSTACLQQAMCADPFDAALPYQAGVNFMLQNRVEEAAAAFAETLRLDPKHFEASHNLARTLHLLGRPADALSGYRLALESSPNHPEALYNIGRALQDLDRLEEAADALRQSIAIRPANADAHCNLGVVLRALGRPREAARCYEDALRWNPEHWQARYNLALAQLVLSDFRSGWESYEWRFQQEDSTFPKFSQPLWTGSPSNGDRILLCPEQGLGDNIQFVRYARSVKGTGGEVLMACPDSLAGPIGTVSGIDRMLNGDALPEFDFYAPLLSLPRIFRTELRTIPSKTPYISAKPALVEEWAAHLRTAGWNRKIGIAWAGSPTHRNDRQRSIDPQEFSALAGLPDTTFISLQKGHEAGYEASRLTFTPLGRELTDFADTAALIMNLDLVISVDTAVAHLAGALARPVWTLLPFAPDWRWMLDRDDTPWYPTMRLFRQQRRGEWQPVLERVRQELGRDAGMQPEAE